MSDIKDPEAQKALDKIAAAGLLVYTVKRAKGMSESEAVYEAVRYSVEVVMETVESTLSKLTEGK